MLFAITVTQRIICCMEEIPWQSSFQSVWLTAGNEKNRHYEGLERQRGWSESLGANMKDKDDGTEKAKERPNELSVGQDQQQMILHVLRKQEGLFLRVGPTEIEPLEFRRIKGLKVQNRLNWTKQKVCN